MSEEEQAPGTALLKLFDDAVEAYDSVLWVASAAGLKDLEKTVSELLRRLLVKEGHISGYATMVANIYKISATVADRRADERKVRRLLFEKFADEHGHHLDKDSIEKMAKLAAAELLLQVYIKFFEDVGALRVMA